MDKVKAVEAQQQDWLLLTDEGETRMHAMHTDVIPELITHLRTRIGQTVEIGTREQFEAGVEDEQKPLFHRIDKQSKRIEELASLCEEKDSRIVKLERQLAAKSQERQDLLNRIAKQSAIIRDNEHVIDQQHDHIRQLETRLAEYEADGACLPSDLEILDKPEPTLAECWNLIRNFPGLWALDIYSKEKERITAALHGKEAISTVFQCWRRGHQEPWILTAMDAFIKEQSQ